ncbi:MAG: hypothetical protein MZW92_32440 [Comamonadaceae bacterium]|nr:hypothetical protein [Comamonadaceae bacterium]
MLMGATPQRIIGRHLLPELHEPPDRRRRRCRSRSMILGETALVLPRPRPAPADHVLGRAAERGAEHQRRRALSRG